MSKVNFILVVSILLFLSAVPIVSASESDENTVRVLYVGSRDMYRFSNTTVNGTTFIVDKVFAYDNSNPDVQWKIPSDRFLLLANSGFEGYDVVFLDTVNFYQSPFEFAYLAAHNRGCLLIAINTKPADGDDCCIPAFFDIRDERTHSAQNDFTDRFFAIHDKTVALWGSFGNSPDLLIGSFIDWLFPDHGTDEKMAQLLVDTVIAGKPARIVYMIDLWGTAWVPAPQPIPSDGYVTLSEEIPRIDGIVFCGWTDGQSVFLPGATYKFDKAVTLKAIWYLFPPQLLGILDLDVKELCTALVNGEEAPGYYDMNRDGTIDGRDVILLSSYLARAAESS